MPQYKKPFCVRALMLSGVCVSLISLVSLYPWLSAVKAQQTPLILGQPVQGTLTAKQQQRFSLSLEKGQYVQLGLRPLEASGFDLIGQILAADGTVLITTSEFLSHSAGQNRMLAFIAPSTGNYHLAISPSELSTQQAGSYEVSLTDLRPATQADHWRLSAIKEEGEALNAERIGRVENVQLFRIAKLKEALAYWQRLGDAKNEARVLELLSHNYALRGDLQLSEQYFEQAIAFAKATANRYTEANLLMDAGRRASSLGRYGEALERYQQARQIFQERKARFGEATALSHLGHLYARLGQPEVARQCFEESLQGMTALGFTWASVYPLTGLAELYSHTEDSQRMLELSQQTLKAARDANGDEFIQTALGNLARLYTKLNEPQKAAEHLQEKLSLARKLGQPVLLAETFKFLGEFALQTRSYPQAIEHLQQALSLAQTLNDPIGESSVRASLARASLALGNRTQALEELQQSFRVIESVRGNLINPNLRQSYFATTQANYAFYLDVLMQPSADGIPADVSARAFELSEQTRARGLLDALAEGGTQFRLTLTENEMAEETAWREQVNFKAAALTRLRQGKSRPAEVNLMQRELDQQLLRYDELQNRLRQRYPQYAALNQPRPLNIREIQKQLLDNDTVMLAYALGEQWCYLWAFTPTTITSHRLASRQEVEQSARKVYAGVSQFSASSDTQKQLPLETALLSRHLLSPLAKQLQHEWKGKRLLIVAPEILQYIPFGILPIPSERSNASAPLLTAHEVVSLPSASVLGILRRESGKQVATQSVAVLGDPVFSETDTRVKKAKAPAEALAQQSKSLSPMAPWQQAARSINSDERGNLQRLLFSREEAEAIAAIAPAGSVFKALDFTASRATALSSKLADYRIVHFATHGLLDSAHPELSGLALSLVDERGHPQNGYLRLNEIYNMKLNADLVVLSACQTGLGKEVKGEGLIGLTRGFMYAGAPRIVASLWQVNDAATAELMKRFYRGMLKEKLRPAAALRQAQLELMKKPAWKSPYYWGAFVLQGEWK